MYEQSYQGPLFLLNTAKPETEGGEALFLHGLIDGVHDIADHWCDSLNPATIRKKLEQLTLVTGSSSGAEIAAFRRRSSWLSGKLIFTKYKAQGDRR